MADEINITTNDPEAMRAEIENTRARMSETIDEIEDVLIRKKEEIQDRLDVFSPVRERPFPSLGIVFGIGVLLGFATGGDDDDEDDEEHEYGAVAGVHRGRYLEAEERAEKWEQRARRLLHIAREQEEMLEDSARRRSVLRRGRPAPDLDEDFEDDVDDAPARDATSVLGERIVDFVSTAVRGLVRGAAGRA